MSSTYTITQGQADTLVELAGAGQTCAAVTPDHASVGGILDALAARFDEDDDRVRVRRSNGQESLLFSSGGSIRIGVADNLRGGALHAVAVAGPYEVLLPLTIASGGQVLAP